MIVIKDGAILHPFTFFKKKEFYKDSRLIIVLSVIFNGRFPYQFDHSKCLRDHY